MSMAEEQQRPRLGRGLAALIADSASQMPSSPETRDRRRVATDKLRANPRNPRRNFGPEELEDLASSIRERGIIQPILCRAVPGPAGLYEIIAGERRWRAAQMANLTDVPVVVVDVSDKEAVELAIIENVQRTDLNAIEEARGYERLMQEFSYSQGDVSRIVGKSRSHVANMVRLLKLPSSVEMMVVDGSISAGHARALLSLDNPEAVARRVVARGLTVRDVEKLAQAKAAPAAKPKPAKPALTPIRPDTLVLANRLSDRLGLRVSLEPQDEGGELRIRYRTLEDLENLCRQLIR